MEVSPGDFPAPTEAVDAVTTIPNKIVRHRAHTDAAEDESALSVPKDKILCGVTDYHLGLATSSRALYGREILMTERRSSGGPVSCGVGCSRILSRDKHSVHPSGFPGIQIRTSIHLSSGVVGICLVAIHRCLATSRIRNPARPIAMQLYPFRIT